MIAMLLASSLVADWLVHPPTAKAKIKLDDDKIVMTNGLIRREFDRRSGTTIAFDNLMTGESLLRAVKPEARFEIDRKIIELGGLDGQPDLAYLKPSWIEKMTPRDGPAKYVGCESKGGRLTLRFESSELRFFVVYTMADGLPLISKKIHLENLSKKPIVVNRFTSEILGVVEAESNVDSSPEWLKPPLTVVTDYTFGGMGVRNSNKTIYWEEEPEYKTQVNYELKTPCRLEVRPPLGPNVKVDPGEQFSTFTTYELVQDSTDRERRGLAVRKMFRHLAPWALDNPLMLHLTSTDPEVVHRAIDQAADCGFEMVIISFWSGLDMEDVSDSNIAKFKGFVDYAHQKGLRLGGYSLLASRRIDDENDVINPATGKTGGAIFGQSPCLGSKWGEQYFAKLKKFIEATGFDVLEHDGSYPGDVCASTNHPGHQGLEDSQWLQYHKIADFYAWCRKKGVFLNVPDNYFLAGSNKTGMGYRESNWSLPREQQHIHARQNLFDGTWEKTPSMGWMMVPLVEYQGGGPAATIEPLKEHLDDYGLHLANNLGWGAQACYRGPRLYDSPETRSLVRKWVDWYKSHRDILESDVIHVRRADGRNLDVALHVNPELPTKAMAVIYNPTDTAMEQEIVLPLYYSGLRGKCHVKQEDRKSKMCSLEDSSVRLKVKVPPKGCTWYTFTD